MFSKNINTFKETISLKEIKILKLEMLLALDQKVNHDDITVYALKEYLSEHMLNALEDDDVYKAYIEAVRDFQKYADTEYGLKRKGDILSFNIGLGLAIGMGVGIVLSLFNTIFLGVGVGLGIIIGLIIGLIKEKNLDKKGLLY